MIKHTFFSRQEADNPDIAREILKTCINHRIFAFYGELGAGKTTLIKAFCEALNMQVVVTSPTFNLVNEYTDEKLTVYHFDFYRIKSEIEAYDMGCDEYFDSGNYCFIEWPERIPSLLPDEAVHIHIESLNDHQRMIQVTY
ncbi:MAG: tRNA (adenosine(37)-N6)-threonylcarbamoyltransferase complex ATPase subunit type 1 TsaE [Bacteroidetes bacterium]|nr:MAG: tRNA (adenosine(37)-N6)-threonylcarbamoyltransferase complex ATPase subunit type 1 TsaE [Bacteroidota bacterium]